MKRCNIYKVKEASKHLFPESIISEYVYVDDFARNPLDDNGHTHCIYKHIFIETLDFTSMVLGYYMLPYQEFEGHFNLHMTTDQVNKRLREIESGENRYDE